MTDDDDHDDEIIIITIITSASVKLTQTPHSHSKQLFQGGGTDFSVSTGRVKKLHTLLVSLYF